MNVSDDFRRCMRNFASGVTVVTAAVDGRVHGMTASSFASVSLDPPMVLVCLDRTSRTLKLVHEAGRFAVSILSSSQEDLSRFFSSRGDKSFDEIAHRLGGGGEPLLEGAVAWLECSLDRMITAGDHEIAIGLVERCEADPSPPLLYHDAGYRGLT